MAKNESKTGKVKVNESRPHKRGGGWVRGHWRKDSKTTVNQEYRRKKPKKRKKKKASPEKTKKKQTVQTTLGKPRNRPARRSLLKRESD